MWTDVLKIKNPFKKKKVSKIDLKNLSIEDKIRWAEKASHKNFDELRNMKWKDRTNEGVRTIGRARMMAQGKVRIIQKLILDILRDDIKSPETEKSKEWRKTASTSDVLMVTEGFIYYTHCGESSPPYQTFDTDEGLATHDTPNAILSNFFNDDRNWLEKHQGPYLYETENVGYDGGYWEDTQHIIPDGENVEDGDDRVKVFLKYMLDKNLFQIQVGRVVVN